MTLTFTSLFSGAGGMDLGFIQAGFQPRAAFDSDPIAVKAYQQNIGKHAFQLDIKAQSEQISNAVSSSDVLIAGPPCQGFSTAGLNDPNDVRNELLLRTVQIICENKPPIAVIENVRGLLAPNFKKYIDRLRLKLNMSGYAMTMLMLNANEHGVAQHRRRVFIVASRIGDFSFCPKIQNCVSLRQALSGLKPDHISTAHVLKEGTRDFSIAQAIRPGQKLTNVRTGTTCVHTWDIPDVFGETTVVERTVLLGLLAARRTKRVRSNGDADPVSAIRLTKELGFRTAPILSSLCRRGFVKKVDDAYDLTHTFNGKYRRLSWDEAAPTVDTRFGQPRYFIHPEENRGFSVRETSRIQGFPDAYTFPTAAKDAFRLIGNAVPPPLARTIANQLHRTLRNL